MNARAMRIVHTAGAANALGEAIGDRRFTVWKHRQLGLLEFRIKPPGCKPYNGLFANAQQAREHAERTHPGTFPASVVCTSRQRKAARP